MDLPSNKTLRGAVFQGFNGWMASFNRAVAAMVKAGSEPELNRLVIDFFKRVEVPAWEQVAGITLKDVAGPISGAINKLNVISSTLIDNAALLKVPGLPQVRIRIFDGFDRWKDQFVAFIGRARASAGDRNAVIALKKAFMENVEVKAWDAVKDSVVACLVDFTVKVEEATMVLNPHVERFG